MRNLPRVSDEDGGDVGGDIKDYFQVLRTALHRDGGDQIIEYGSDGVSLFGCRQGALYDFRVV